MKNIKVIAREILSSKNVIDRIKSKNGDFEIEVIEDMASSGIKSSSKIDASNSLKSLMKLGYGVKYHSLTRSYEPTYKDKPIGNSTHSSVENGWKYIQDYFLKLSKEDQEKMINYFNK